MSVLIKGMKLPTSCTDCPMMQDEWVSCKLTGSWEWADEFVPSKERLKDCPLIELPPHGRLIDADALKEASKDTAFVIPWWLVDSAPTILEAEEEE